MSLFKKLKKVFKVEPEMDLLREAQLAFSDKDLEKAIELWIEAMKREESRLKAGLKLLWLHRTQNIDIDTEGIIHQLKKSFPTEGNVWLESARMNKIATNYEQTFDDAYKAIQCNSKLFGAFQLLMTSSFHIRKTHETKRVLDQYYPKFKNEDYFKKVYFTFHNSFDGDPRNLEISDQTISGGHNELLDYGDVLIGVLRKNLDYLFQVRNKSNRTKISLEYRNKAICEPKELIELWHKTNTYKKLDEKRVISRASKGEIYSNLNILFVSLLNWNFMQALVERTSVSFKDKTISTLDFGFIEKHVRKSCNSILYHALANQEQALSDFSIEHYWVQQLNSADTIFVEWCNEPALWLSWVLPPKKKLVIRIHSYEVFTTLPHLVNWGNVDEVVFVSTHISEYANQLFELDKYGVKRRVIRNLNERFEKLDVVPNPLVCSIAMIGYNNKNKNPIMGLQVLKTLLANDISAKIVFIGSPWNDESLDDDELNYYRNFNQFIKEHQLDENVEFVAFNTRVEEEYHRFNFILSASDREGTHESCIQAMMAGKIPIIRMWPILEHFGSARTVYDERWIFDSSDSMADYIQKIVKSEQAFLCEQKVAQDFAFDNFSVNHVWPQFEKLFNS
ncbi:MAG: glycosyltransferase [Salibacteraceae bacterium]|nr:glycosyltransferase [Salibacteraceae bacterium]